MGKEKHYKYFDPSGASVSSSRWQQRLPNLFLWFCVCSQVALYILVLILEEWKLASVYQNPTVGVGLAGLQRLGATASAKIVEGEWWRLPVSMFLPAGAIHLWANASLIWTFGAFLASALNVWELACIYLLSGAAGVLVSANISGSYVTAGASGPGFGLVGGTCSALLLHRRLFVHHFLSWLIIVLVLLLNLFIGATPFVDNAGNVGGFVAGALATLGFLLLERRGVSSANREWLLRLACIGCLCAALSISILGVIGLVTTRPVADCCDRWVCTPNRLWDCEASRMHLPCSWLRFKNSTISMTCPNDGSVQTFTGILSDKELQDLCSTYCYGPTSL